MIPDLPQSGKGKRMTVRQGQEHRLLVSFSPLPLIEPIGQDQASSFFEGSAEAGFGGDGFRPCVDHLTAEGGFFGPKRHESPNITANPLDSERMIVPMTLILSPNEITPRQHEGLSWIWWR